jgi:hypothetical protein
MPIYKVTLHIQDGLTLGHVLMTKGVELIHIVETDGPKLIEHKPAKTNGHAKPTRTNFVHPDGKTSSEFIIEYMDKQNNKQARWGELRAAVYKEGFSKSTVNNGIIRLLSAKVIEKKGPALYQLVRKK